MPLGSFPVTVVTPVQWGDMDAFEHVNNTVYLRWFESARIAYFGTVEIAKTSAELGARPILARATVDFRRPVTFPDTVHTAATVTKIGTTSFVMGYRVTSEKLGAVVAEGEGVIVMIDPASGKPTPISDELKQRVMAVEQ